MRKKVHWVQPASRRRKQPRRPPTFPRLAATRISRPLPLKALGTAKPDGRWPKKVAIHPADVVCQRRSSSPVGVGRGTSIVEVLARRGRQELGVGRFSATRALYPERNLHPPKRNGFEKESPNSSTGLGEPAVLGRGRHGPLPLKAPEMAKPDVDPARILACARSSPFNEREPTERCLEMVRFPVPSAAPGFAAVARSAEAAVGGAALALRCASLFLRPSPWPLRQLCTSPLPDLALPSPALARVNLPGRRRV